MHGPNFFFSFHFLSFAISFPKLTIFTILRLYMASKIWKTTALIWEISIASWTLVEKFHISAFPVYYCLCNWIEEHGITKLKIIFASNREKTTQKHAQKDINEMEWHKMDYLIFQQWACVNAIYFCTRSHNNVPYEKQQELNKGSEPWN